MEPTDFFEWILNKYSDDAEKDIYLIPELARPVVCIIIAHFPISNGGYQNLFENNLNGNITYEMLLESYKVVGLTGIADSFKKLLDIFPGGNPQTNLRDRRIFLNKYFIEENPDGSMNNAYSPLVDMAEDIYYREFDDISNALQKYYEEIVG